MKEHDLTRLIQANARYVRSPVLHDEHMGFRPSEGEFRRTAVDWEGAEGLVLVLQEEGEVDGILAVAPVHFSPEYAGPDDLVLPRDFLGRTAVVCTGASMNTTQEELGDFRGRLPDEWMDAVRQLEAAVDAGERPADPMLRGVDYLDTADQRWGFKQDLAEAFSSLQVAALTRLDQADKTSENKNTAKAGEIIDLTALFPASPPIALAADDSNSADRPLRSYKLTSVDGKLVLMLSEAEESGYLALEAPVELDGAGIVDAEGCVIGRIHGQICYFKMPASMQFSIEMKNGNQVSMICSSAGPDDDGTSFSS